jgi:uncharacterized protein
MVIDTVLIKTASRCNLDCTYCYVYNMGDDGWKKQPKRMSHAVADALTEQLGALSHAQVEPLSVIMHGGEPLMLGFRDMARLVEGLRQALRADSGLHIQTNGVLLSEEFLDLFAAHDVGVSISFDGPVSVHDKFRVDKRGRGSHGRVMNAIGRLRSHPAGDQLFGGVLAVIDPTSDPGEVYQALKETGAPGFDLLYQDGNHDVLPRGKSSVDSTEFGDWMVGLLGHYVRDSTPPRIRVLDDLMRLLLGGDGVKEGVGLTDFGILVIDTDGSVAKKDTLKVAHDAADRFAHQWSVENNGLLAALADDEFSAYHTLQRPTAKACLACPILSVCGGGMPAHRWSKAKGYDNPTVFCADQKRLIAQLQRYLASARAAAPMNSVAVADNTSQLLSRATSVSSISVPGHMSETHAYD